jgi:hypothetical protein
MQFAVYQMPRGSTGFIVEVQSRLLEDLATRVLLPKSPKPSCLAGYMILRV